MPRIKETLDAVPDTGLSELIYTLITELSKEQKKEFPLVLLKKINTAKKAAKFATSSTLDQKQEFFSYLGFYSFFTLIDGIDVTPLNFRETFKSLKKEKPLSMVEEMVNKGFYITSDLDFTYSLSLLSAAKNSSFYKAGMQLRRTGYHLKKWPKKITHPKEEEITDLKESDMVLDKVMGATLETFDMVDVASDVEKDEFRILLFLKQYQGFYKTYEEVCDHFGRRFMKRAIAGAIRKLKEKQMIQKHVMSDKREYTITKMGIRAIQSFKTRVFQSFNF